MKKTILLSVISIAIMVMVSGCQNAYSQFYTPYLQEPLKPTKKVDYYTYSNENDITNAVAKGYRVIGYSGFTSTKAPTKAQAISQAKKIGADIVMVTWEYQNQETNSVPVMNYTPGTSSTTYSNANAYGSNGSSAYGYGTSTTYTQGTYSTSYVQQTTHRYAYGAYYLVKIDVKKFSLGVSWAKKTAEMSKKIGTNSGCPIRVVYENTPAYYNDLMNGDIILKANGEKVRSCQDVGDILAPLKVISFEIWRNGKILNINEIKLNK